MPPARGPRRLLVCGAVLIDDLVFADGRTLSGVLGGAGLYALAGAALWHDDVVLISGVGEDAEGHLLPWMRQADLADTALRIDGAFTPRNRLVYRADGTRTETPVFGPAHLERLQPSASDLVAAIARGGGAYVFRNADPVFWSKVGDAARRHESLLLWEISADVCTPSEMPAIAHAARQVDALSINLEECAGLFGTSTFSAIIEGLRGLGAAVTFLRCGADGSFVVTPRDIVPIAALPARVVDVTGAGNAYGGAALAGLAAGAGPVQAAHMSAVASWFAIAQHGPFHPRDPAVRADAAAALKNRSGADGARQTPAGRP